MDNGRGHASKKNALIQAACISCEQEVEEGDPAIGEQHGTGLLHRLRRDHVGHQVRQVIDRDARQQPLGRLLGQGEQDHLASGAAEVEQRGEQIVVCDGGDHQQRGAPGQARRLMQQQVLDRRGRERRDGREQLQDADQLARGCGRAAAAAAGRCPAARRSQSGQPAAVRQTQTCARLPATLTARSINSGMWPSQCRSSVATFRKISTWGSCVGSYWRDSSAWCRAVAFQCTRFSPSSGCHASDAGGPQRIFDQPGVRRSLAERVLGGQAQFLGRIEPGVDDQALLAGKGALARVNMPKPSPVVSVAGP